MKFSLNRGVNKIVITKSIRSVKGNVKSPILNNLKLYSASLERYISR